MYILLARNIVQGHGWTIDSAAVTAYPPLFPGILASLSLGKFDPVVAGRWLQAIVFGMNVFWVGVLTLRFSGGSVGTSICASVAALCAVDMLGYHSIILSDGLFLLFSLPALAALHEYVEKRSVPSLLSAVAFTSLATLTRYVGVAWIIAGALAILLFADVRIRERIIAALVFALGSLFPLFVWFLRNFLLHSFAGRRFSIHPFFGEVELKNFLQTVSQWFLQGTIPASRWMIALPLLLFVTLFLARRWNRRHGVPVNDPPLRLPALFCSIYILFLIFSAAFFQGDLFRDGTRLFLPLHALTIIMVATSVRRRMDGLTSGSRLLLKACVLIYCGFLVVGSIRYISHFRQDGQGYASRLYRDSKLFDVLKALPSEYSIYSNADLPISLYTGRSPDFLPMKVDNQTLRANTEYENQMERMTEDLKEGGGVLVYFARDDNWFELPSLDEIKKRIPLRCIASGSDGAIYDVPQDSDDAEQE